MVIFWLKALTFLRDLKFHYYPWSRCVALNDGHHQDVQYSTPFIVLSKICLQTNKSTIFLILFLAASFIL